jgi:hypothetical protein
MYKGLTLKINDKMISSGPDQYYTKSFMDILEAHMPYLRNHHSTQVVTVNEKDASVYNADLYGYLFKIAVPAHFHWCIMRMNQMNSTYEFTNQTKTIILPNETIVDKIKQTYKMKTGIIGI